MDKHYLAFHTPFGGMVKGAHRSMMRKIVKKKNSEIAEDFNQRVAPGLVYCQLVGNIMGATTALSLASTIDNGQFESPKRIGCFSYGSGCCSEFFSGISSKEGQEKLSRHNIGLNLKSRYRLNLDEYESIIQETKSVAFGTRNTQLDTQFISTARTSLNGTPRLFLNEIKNYHRTYEWIP